MTPETEPLDGRGLAVGSRRWPAFPEDWESIPDKDKLIYADSRDGNEPYVLGPESQPQAGVPNGTISQSECRSSFVYPGVERSYSVYVPAQYDVSQPAALMVFQDGDLYLREGRVATVFDNLIATGDMPVTIGLFVNPGQPGPGVPVYGGAGNRTYEYDNTNADYATFLAEELLPELKGYLNISDDPWQHGICGFSSGGSCAFSAAWFRPDVFRRVVSHCGSFIDIHGAHNYPTWIRRQYKRPMKVFLQTGARDLDIKLGNVPLSSRVMESALKYRDYDVNLVFGEGGHTLLHGAAIFPDTMRWLWNDSAATTGAE